MLISENEAKNILIISSKLDVQSDYIYIAHISEQETKNYFYSLPSQQTVIIPNGYGEYPLQSVYQLLKIDKKDDQFIKATYSELLGTTIDDVFTIDVQLNDIDEDKFSNFFFMTSVNNLMKLKLNKVIKPLYLHYQSKDISLTKLEKPEDIQNYIEKISTIYGDVYQYCSVAVINSSQVNGLAKKKSKIIENTGALVVRVDDSEEKQNQTKIYYGDDPVNCEPLAKKLSNIFYQKPEIIPMEKLENAQQYRSKIIVVVGE